MASKKLTLTFEIHGDEDDVAVATKHLTEGMDVSVVTDRIEYELDDLNGTEDEMTIVNAELSVVEDTE